MTLSIPRVAYTVWGVDKGSNLQLAIIHLPVPQIENFAIIPTVCGKHRAWMIRFLKPSHK